MKESLMPLLFLCFVYDVSVDLRWILRYCVLTKFKAAQLIMATAGTDITMKSLFEEIGYLIPNFVLHDEDERSIGICGQRHERWLKRMSVQSVCSHC